MRGKSSRRRSSWWRIMASPDRRCVLCSAVDDPAASFVEWMRLEGDLEGWAHDVCYWRGVGDNFAGFRS
jgi:hypothetical protein